MSVPSMICDNTSKGILNTRNSFLLKYDKPYKQVTIVQTTTSQAICSKDSHFITKILSYSMKVTHLEEASFTSLLNVFREGKNLHQTTHLGF